MFSPLDHAFFASGIASIPVSLVFLESIERLSEAALGAAFGGDLVEDVFLEQGHGDLRFLVVLRHLRYYHIAHISVNRRARTREPRWN